MKIQDAIDMLTEAKAKGAKNIIFAFWTADCFGTYDDPIGVNTKFEDNEDWETIAQSIEDNMDWSWAHDDMMDYIESLPKLV